MLRIGAEFQIVSPMFIRKTPTDKPELRVSSLRGALRYWFRATAWPRYAGADNGLEELRQLESGIFGSAKTGQGKLLLTLDNTLGGTDPFLFSQYGQGLGYLGYGVLSGFGSGAQSARPSALRYGHRFNVQGLLRKGATDQHVNWVIRSFKALNYFGGLGARSRRGFGSVSLCSLNVDGQNTEFALQDLNGLQRQVEHFLSDLGALDKKLPPHTSFSTSSRIVIGQGGRDVMDVLNLLGIRFAEARKAQKVGEIDKLRALSYSTKPRKQDKPHPHRVIYGLPHNYFVKGSSESYVLEPRGKDLGDRRASPLFFHMHPLESGFAVIATFLPAQFLPAGSDIQVTRTQGQSRATVALVPNHAMESLQVLDPLTGIFQDWPGPVKEVEFP